MLYKLNCSDCPITFAQLVAITAVGSYCTEGGKKNDWFCGCILRYLHLVAIPHPSGIGKGSHQSIPPQVQEELIFLAIDFFCRAGASQSVASHLACLLGRQQTNQPTNFLLWYALLTTCIPRASTTKPSHQPTHRSTIRTACCNANKCG